ncbi:LOW QUALITY PROTEIN: hypothetical protein QTO34_001097 [Cnephaeus nilssonii]|uniref:Ferritin light chain n=1 Tax=Cnephaeus nilssonii TaxID=3371016 RepID=A0AA40LNC0_CNENI|nr:LOW QUALITY PROTEIN: hypothetical protein QTO34_001097 [Eptesicus nilssonii]
MSSQIPQNYPTEVEAAVNGLATYPNTILPLRASLTHLSLDDVALQGVGHFFRELVETWEGAEHLNDAKPAQRGGRILFQDRILSRILPKRKGQNSGHCGSRPGLGEDLNQALEAMQAWGSAHPDPQLWDFLENHFRGEEVKLINKMGDT